MGLIDALPALARALRAGVDVYDAYKGDQDAQKRVWRSGVPALMDGAMPGAGTIANLGIELLDRRGQAALPAPGDVVDAEFHSSALCDVCGPEYKPAGEARLVREIAGMPFGLVYFVGREGTGKTAGTFRLAELWDRPTFVMGVPQRSLPLDWKELRIPANVLKPRRPPRRRRRQAEWEDDDVVKFALPEPEQADEDEDSPLQRWIEGHIGQRATVLVDDATLVLDSAASGSTNNRVVRNLIAIMRHLEMNLCINTQVTAAVTKYALNARCLFQKPPVRRWQAQERDLVKTMLEDGVADWWLRLPESAWKTHAWADSETYSGPVHLGLPTFWSDKLSRNKAAA